MSGQTPEAESASTRDKVPTPVSEDGEENEPPTINVVPQKVVKVNTPAKYYGDRDKTKTFIFQLRLYWTVNDDAFPDSRSKVVFAASYCQGRALEWVQPYMMEYLEKGWNKTLHRDTAHLLDPVNFITQLQTMFGEIDPKQEAEGRLLRLKQTSTVPHYTAAFTALKVQCSWGDEA